eukprot:gb/GECH01001204.1/.p1 GENE.gb/GECH01001204.1/~~gb/GECH01001204.1/.p1  ORF type:complete len:422 (+),score=123.10 gb/GECH01001204.1/:1-1266(+)
MAPETEITNRVEEEENCKRDNEKELSTDSSFSSSPQETNFISNNTHKNQNQKERNRQDDTTSIVSSCSNETESNNKKTDTRSKTTSDKPKKKTKIRMNKSAQLRLAQIRGQEKKEQNDSREDNKSNLEKSSKHKKSFSKQNPGDYKKEKNTLNKNSSCKYHHKKLIRDAYQTQKPQKATVKLKSNNHVPVLELSKVGKESKKEENQKPSSSSSARSSRKSTRRSCIDVELLSKGFFRLLSDWETVILENSNLQQDFTNLGPRNEKEDVSVKRWLDVLTNHLSLSTSIILTAFLYVKQCIEEKTQIQCHSSPLDSFETLLTTCVILAAKVNDDISMNRFNCNWKERLNTATAHFRSIHKVNFSSCMRMNGKEAGKKVFSLCRLFTSKINAAEVFVLKTLDWNLHATNDQLKKFVNDTRNNVN